MKRCPTCKRTYTDPNLSYCVEDGTPLTTEEPGDESTVVSPYRPPGSYVPPASVKEKRRRLWPSVLGLAGAFGIGAIVLLIAAAVLVPRFAKTVERNTPPNHNAETTDTPEKFNVPPPTNQDEVLAQLSDIENEWTT